MVNTTLLGHLDNPVYLAGLGLGSTFASILSMSISLSFAGGLDTLVSQAFGARDFKLCAIYLDRQVFMCMILNTVTVIPLLFSEKIFLAMGFDPDLSFHAA